MSSMGERCATAGCFHGNLSFFERGGVGSWYCSGCYAKVLQLERSQQAHQLRSQSALIAQLTAALGRCIDPTFGLQQLGVDLAMARLNGLDREAGAFRKEADAIKDAARKALDEAERDAARRGGG